MNKVCRFCSEAGEALHEAEEMLSDEKLHVFSVREGVRAPLGE